MADDIVTVPEMLRYRWETEPDSKNFHFLNKDGPLAALTAGEIYVLAGKFASRLRQYGFEAGDVIANGIPNSPERLVTDMGIIMAGCVIVNCQVVEKDGSNFFSVARMSKCSGVILPNRESNDAFILLSPLISNIAKSAMQCCVLSVQQSSALKKAIIVNREEGNPENSFLDNLRSSDDEILCTRPSSSDMAVIFATSGSSGYSKLVPFSHDKIFSQARMFKAIKGITSFTDRPMGWVGGFPFDFLAHGSERYVQDQFDNLHEQTVSGLWEVISRAGCQGAALLPGAIYELVDIFKKQPPDFKLQFVTTGGQPMRESLVKALGLLCSAIVVSYGSTETGISTFGVISHPSQFKDFQCGKPMTDVELKVVDDAGVEVETGIQGNLLVKCPRALPHYYNQDTNPQTSDIYTTDGYYKTGDIAKVDSEGFLYCYGRAGEVVSIGSVLLYLSWPEDILNKCPFLQNSSVIGIEEENGNAFLCACVIPCLDTDVSEKQVIDYFDQALVTNAQKQSSMAKMTHVFIIERFPMLPSGKVNKLHLKRFVYDQLRRSH